jgi:NAD(P)-dependent dehydrogenase (short-subunit alcohol dehydrogenase family)
MGDRLSGKVAVVTGANAGIGRAISTRFAAEGARVLAVDVSEGEDLADEAIVVHRADVSDSGAWREIIATARRLWGRLDVLCNNAGIAGGEAPVADFDEEIFDRVLAVNVRGPFLGMKYAIPLMLEGGGGSIINMASIGSFVAQPNSCAYLSSKGAVLMLTKTAALEYARQGLRINAICPGGIETPLVANAMAPQRLEAFRQLHPVGRLGRPEEIAAMAVFLASDESCFATGAAFVVDGGRTAT